ncbi:hypothetical protein [Kitasatospora cathayae]|uniref:Integral membrane protein n=1 Tax=Kitasatospora cathayae TaxID=3004092 RepID=A0ABY7QHD1_9ACTN|nr:hypothetical protein [Kitasatospora sp. HUAS 3-15]WBP92198.1 hypothetical protein O1G21_41050 [Kitasatospora sp. HUAS 3-15]
MTKHSTRAYRARAAAAFLLDSLADGVYVAAVLAAGALGVAHVVPIGGHAVADLTFPALMVLVTAFVGCGHILRHALGTLADLVDPVTENIYELPTAAFTTHEHDSADPGVYETEHDGTWPEAIDWAAEAAVAVGQLRVDFSQPDADLDDLLISLQASRLVRELHDLLVRAAEQYGARGERGDQEEAAALREAAVYADMAAMTLGDKPERTVRPRVAPPAYHGAGAEDDELTF